MHFFGQKGAYMKHLTLEIRNYIQLRLKMGDSFRSIACDVGVSHTTISREVNRNTGKRGYRYKQADRFATMRHKVKNKAVKLTSAVTGIIDKYLISDWSPEADCRQNET
jgi:IS30 family transposase